MASCTWTWAGSWSAPATASCSWTSAWARINNDKYAGGGFLDGLRAHGVAPADVTDVVFTHLHFDHVGWATRKGEVVFPNATYRVHADDWAHFVDAPEADAGAVRKLSGRCRPGWRRSPPTVRSPPVSTPGTPPATRRARRVYVVSSGGERALLLGDAVHSVVELGERDWEAVLDVDPVAARPCATAGPRGRRHQGPGGRRALPGPGGSAAW